MLNRNASFDFFVIACIALLSISLLKMVKLRDLRLSTNPYEFYELKITAFEMPAILLNKIFSLF